MINDTNDGSAARPTGNRRVIHSTCSVHGGCAGFTNLAVFKLGGDIVMDPHAIGACVIKLDENAARVLRETLTEWLG